MRPARAAQAFCQGGEIDDETMQLLDTKQGGIDVTLGDATDIKKAVDVRTRRIGAAGSVMITTARIRRVRTMPVTPQ